MGAGASSKGQASVASRNREYLRPFLSVGDFLSIRFAAKVSLAKGNSELREQSLVVCEEKLLFVPPTKSNSDPATIKKLIKEYSLQRVCQIDVSELGSESKYTLSPTTKRVTIHYKSESSTDRLSIDNCTRFTLLLKDKKYADLIIHQLKWSWINVMVRVAENRPIQYTTMLLPVDDSEVTKKEVETSLSLHRKGLLQRFDQLEHELLFSENKRDVRLEIIQRFIEFANSDRFISGIFFADLETLGFILSEFGAKGTIFGTLKPGVRAVPTYDLEYAHALLKLLHALIFNSQTSEDCAAILDLPEGHCFNDLLTLLLTEFVDSNDDFGFQESKMPVEKGEVNWADKVSRAQVAILVDLDSIIELVTIQTKILSLKLECPVPLATQIFLDDSTKRQRSKAIGRIANNALKIATKPEKIPEKERQRSLYLWRLCRVLEFISGDERDEWERIAVTRVRAAFSDKAFGVRSDEKWIKDMNRFNRCCPVFRQLSLQAHSSFFVDLDEKTRSRVAEVRTNSPLISMSKKLRNKGSVNEGRTSFSKFANGLGSPVKKMSSLFGHSDSEMSDSQSPKKKRKKRRSWFGKSKKASDSNSSKIENLLASPVRVGRRSIRALHADQAKLAKKMSGVGSSMSRSAKRAKWLAEKQAKKMTGRVHGALARNQELARKREEAHKRVAAQRESANQEKRNSRFAQLAELTSESLMNGEAFLRRRGLSSSSASSSATKTKRRNRKSNKSEGTSIQRKISLAGARSFAKRNAAKVKAFATKEKDELLGKLEGLAAKRGKSEAKEAKEEERESNNNHVSKLAKLEEEREKNESADGNPIGNDIPSDVQQPQMWKENPITSPKTKKKRSFFSRRSKSEKEERKRAKEDLKKRREEVKREKEAKKKEEARKKEEEKKAGEQEKKQKAKKEEEEEARKKEKDTEAGLKEKKQKGKKEEEEAREKEKEAGDKEKKQKETVEDEDKGAGNKTLAKKEQNTNITKTEMDKNLVQETSNITDAEKDKKIVTDEQ
eukprot:g1575.t1